MLDLDLGELLRLLLDLDLDRRLGWWTNHKLRDQ
jgi:hypothetical protein